MSPTDQFLGGGGGGGGGGKSASSSASATSGNNFSLTNPEGGLSTVGIIVLAAVGLFAFVALVIIVKR